MPKRAKAPTGFYTASEVRRMLGIPSSTLYDMVKAGKIERVVPPGRSDGYYPRSSIDDMVRAKELFLLQYATNPATFVKAIAQDAQGIYDVGVSLWGTAGTPTVETRLGWYRSNPDIDYVVKQDGVVAGYISLMPFKHETIEQLVAGTKRGWEVTPEELLPFVPGVPLEAFVMALGVRAGLRKAEKYGMRLLSGAAHALGNLAENGVILDKLYATSNSPDGIKACRDFGFEEIDPDPGTTRKRFMLDITASDSLLLREYHHVHR
jgi:Helix-turn-helix domain